MIVSNQHYTLHVKPKPKKTEIIMELKNGILNNTQYFPKTVSILDLMMPTVLQTRCFNDKHKAFTEEVRSTEIGHLFEHILIDVMCQQKAKLALGPVTYSGETSWNWKKYKPGTFYITITATKKEKELLETSLSHTISVINTVLESH